MARKREVMLCKSAYIFCCVNNDNEQGKDGERNQKSGKELLENISIY